MASGGGSLASATLTREGHLGKQDEGLPSAVLVLAIDNDVSCPWAWRASLPSGQLLAELTRYVRNIGGVDLMEGGKSERR